MKWHLKTLFFSWSNSERMVSTSNSDLSNIFTCRSSNWIYRESKVPVTVWLTGDLWVETNKSKTSKSLTKYRFVVSNCKKKTTQKTKKNNNKNNNLFYSYDRLSGVLRSEVIGLCVCAWLTQVHRQPGRLILHSAGWPRGWSMDGGGSGVWQWVRGRTERAPLLLWIDTETQSMAHKAPRCMDPEPKHPHTCSPLPRLAPTTSASLTLKSVRTRLCSLIMQHTGPGMIGNALW